MADNWRVQTRTDALGQPVVLLEVRFARTIACTPAEFASLKDTIHESGLKEATRYMEFALTCPPDVRPACKTEWADVKARSVNLMTFNKIVQLLLQRPFFRIEGNSSSGFTGVLATSDTETRVPLTIESIPKIVAQLQKLKADAAASNDEGLEGICTGIDGSVGELGKLCHELQEIRDFQEREAQRQQDEIRRAQQRAKAAKEREEEFGGHVDRPPKEIMRGDGIDRVERAMRTA